MYSKITFSVAFVAVFAFYYPLTTTTTVLPTAITAFRSKSLAFANTLKNHLSLVNTRVTMSTTTSTTTAPTSAFLGLPAVPPNDPSLNAPPNASVPRKIKFHFEAHEQAEGVGAIVRRSIGTPKLRNFSPFLMCDHFSSEKGGGFPDHPHRGQETITYMLQGESLHEDFEGNAGVIRQGDLQFMTAGRGIMHSEIPNAAAGVSSGMQIWVDLPQKLKMTEPRYRDLRSEEIPSYNSGDGKVHVKVISGQSHGVDSVQELAYTPVWLLDVTIKPGGKFIQPVPVTWNTFVYVLKGSAIFGEGKDKQFVPTYHNVVFEQKGDTVVAEVEEGEEDEARFVIVSGIPLDQKVVQYGPFVMNSQEEIYQTMQDFRSYTNGFEKAKGWQSKIGKDFRG